MLIVDGHLDLSWNALSWNRDLQLPVSDVRLSEADLTGKARGCNTVSFPEMRRGQIGICFATLLARSNPNGRHPMLDYRSQEIACAVAHGQLSYYRLLEESGICQVITNGDALQTTFEQWSDSDRESSSGFVLSMEGADPILAPTHAAKWFEAGLRIVGLAHYGPGTYAHGTASSGGLSAKGRELLRAMEEAGLILDMTHLADESFWEAARLFRGPVLASHNNCRALTPGDRQFDDDQIRLLIERDAVIGAVLDAWMLAPNWNDDPARRPKVMLENVVDNIDHICQLAGSTRNVAIGSDLDGGFGTEQGPEDLDTIADLQKLRPILTSRGYSASDIAAIFHGNWVRTLKKAWNVESA